LAVLSSQGGTGFNERCPAMLVMDLLVPVGWGRALWIGLAFSGWVNTLGLLGGLRGQKRGDNERRNSTSETPAEVLPAACCHTLNPLVVIMLRLIGVYRNRNEMMFPTRGATVQVTHGTSVFGPRFRFSFVRKENNFFSPRILSLFCLSAKTVNIPVSLVY